ncbi:hypothetical protein HUJ04_005228 [Dendroctonus ponderosae]|nr:hypothetical protein HUJ04_005228 [Dendroctonus ponderosae]
MEQAKTIEVGLQMAAETSEGLPSNEVGMKRKRTFMSSAKYMISHMTIEPVLVFYILPSMMITIAVQNLNLEKACRVNLGISAEHCDAIANRSELAYPDYQRDEEQVQTLATYMTILKNIIESVIPGIILLFLGAWSDKFQKRKPCMLVPVLGDVLSVTGLLFCTYFYYEWPMEVNSLCESFFPAITGSWFAMFTGVYSYISDLSTEEERTMRIDGNAGCLSLVVGFYGVYLIALCMYSVSLVYGYFFIHDPKEESSDNAIAQKSKGFLRDFFQTEHITETLKTVVRTGNKRGRKKRVCAIMFLFIVIIGPVYGELNVVYFFVRLQFGWDSVEYSFFATFQFITNILEKNIC